MRTMLSIRVPVEAGNAGIQSGELAKVMQSTLASLHAEAAYFTTMGDGDRGGYVFFDLEDPSQIPAIAEPLFQKLHAQVRFQPVMSAEDLQRGLGRLGQ
jgi:hypothetical protein